MKYCKKEAELGAHVYIRKYEDKTRQWFTDRDYYILPCCQSCNQEGMRLKQRLERVIIYWLNQLDNTDV